jgi:hypothetical protein
MTSKQATTMEVEAALSPSSLSSSEALLSLLQSFLVEHVSKNDLFPGLLPLPNLQPKELATHFKSIRFADFCMADSCTPLRVIESSSETPVMPVIHLYRQSSEPPEADSAGDGGDDDATHSITQLPNDALDGLWESLCYADGLKQSLLTYATTIMSLSSLNIDANICTLNRVVLLYGPPGTGKTSLGRALAHKLAIRTSSRFQNAMLLEINSHSLFSRWFSESGKKIFTLFEHIRELCEDPSNLVVVLVDEVESLTAARSVTSGEPTDGLRAVNAILTSLDRIRVFPNALIITTSNMMTSNDDSSAIDAAFLSRCDMKVFVGEPCEEAVYDIVRSCIVEFARVGIVTADDALGVSFDDAREAKSDLYRAASRLHGASGRLLRKIPVLAYMKFGGRKNIPMSAFLEKMVEERGGGQ